MTKLFDFKSDRLNGLDHLRALAIIMVMIFHYNQGVPVWLEPIQKIGWTGVDLFFVLSGYLIGFQLLKEAKSTNNISFKKFYFKRFFRIIPAYIAVLVIYYSLSDLREGNGMPPLWKFLTFTQNFGLDVQHAKSFSHAWSLCIEEQFYLLLPIVILIIFSFKFQNRIGYLIVGLIFLGFVFRIYNWYYHVQQYIISDNRQEMIYGFLEKIYYPSYNRMDGLLIGVSIAAIFNFKPKLKELMTSNGNFVLLIGLGIFVSAYFICSDLLSFSNAIFGFPIVSIAYGFIVIAAISPSCILYKFKSKTTFVIASLSYVIYLSHKQLFYLVKTGVQNYGFDTNSNLVFWACIIIAVLGGLILHFSVERPFLKLRDRLITKENFTTNIKYRKLLLSFIVINSKKFKDKIRP